MSPRISRLVRFGTLFVCLLLAGVWWAGRRADDVVIKGSGRGYWEITVIAGQLRIARVEGLQPLASWRWYRGTAPPTLMVFGHQVLGRRSPFSWEFTRTGSQAVLSPVQAGALSGPRRLVTTTYRLVAIPIPLLMLLFLAPTAMHLFKQRLQIARRLSRRSAGLCAHCGYDLRGGGASGGRCPECGLLQNTTQDVPSSASAAGA